MRSLHAGGVFLYARSVLDDLHRRDVYANLMSIAHVSLPAGMFGWYEQRLELAYPGGAGYGEFCRPLLEVLGAAVEAVPESLLAEMLRVTDDTEVRYERTLDFVKQFCRSGGALAFFHQSFADWLFESGKHSFFGKVARGHGLLADLVESRGMGEGGTGREDGVAEGDFLMRHGLTHLCEAERLSEARARLLDFGWLLRRVQTDVRGPVTDGEMQVWSVCRC